MGQPAPQISFESEGQNSVIPKFLTIGATGNAAPLVIAGFDYRFIVGSTQNSGALNTLTVSLSSYVFIPRGSIIQLYNLVANNYAQNSTVLAITAGNTSLLGNNGSFQTASGIFAITLLDDWAARINYSFSFGIMNPIAAQSSPNISVSMRGPILSYPDLMINGIKTYAPLFVVGFATSSISQSTASSIAWNTITMIITSTLDIPGGNLTRIVVSGLTGSATSDTNNLTIMSSFGESAVWYQHNGTLILNVSGPIFAGTQYTVAFLLFNGYQPQPSPIIYIQLQGSIVSQKIAMNRATGTLAPMCITTIYTMLEQSTPSQGLPNNLTLTLSSYSTIFPSSVQVTLTGLVYTVTPDENPLLNLSCQTSTFGATAAWNRLTGTLIFSPVGIILMGQNYTLCFLLNNPTFGQYSPAISIQIQAIVLGSSNSSAISNRAVGKGAGNLAPLLIADFLNTTLGQSTTSSGITNILTVTIIPRTILYTTAAITITGLINASWPTGPIVLRDASNDMSCGQPASCQLLFSSDAGGSAGFGSWLGNGTLVLYVVRIFGANTSAKFAFSLVNPAAGQFSPSISIQSNGLNAVVTAVAMGKDVGNAAPLAVAGFYLNLISQSTPSQGVINTLTVSLWPYTTLPANTTIMISNLLGANAQTAALVLSDPTDAIATAACSSAGGCSKALSNTSNGTARLAQWNNQSKVVTVYLLSNWISGTLKCLVFNLINPFTPQASPNILVSAAGPNGNISPLVLSKDLWNSAPLLIAGFVLKEIRQSTALNHAYNSIYVNCSMNVRLSVAYSVSLTIAGLTGSETVDTKAMIPNMNNKDVLFSNFSWSRSNGTLVAFLVKSQNDSIASFSFSIILQNPIFGQMSPPVFISTGGMVVSSILMDPGQSFSSMPLFVYGFLIYAIGQNSTQALGPNVITITLQSTINLVSTAVSSAQITISGLVNTTQTTGSLPLIDENNSMIFLPQVDWYHDTGTAIISIQPSSSFLAFTTYVLSFVISNPAEGNGVDPTVNATGSTLSESFDPLEMSLTQGPAYCLLINNFIAYSVSQSTPSALALNTITATLSTSAALVVGTTVKISNLTATNTTDGLLPIKGTNANQIFGQYCLWTQISGTLLCTVQNNSLPRFVYTFSFTVQNPILGQDSPAVSIETTFPSSISQILMNYGAGNTAPLLIARFLTNGIQQSTVSSGAVNTLLVSFSFSVSLFGSVADIWIAQAGQGSCHIKCLRS